MSSFFNLFRSGASNKRESGSGGERATRRSNGLAELSKRMATDGSSSILDLGPTSAANITYFTNLGTRTCTEDVISASRDSQYLVANSDGSKVVDPDKFLADNLNYDAGTFDAVLLWDCADYLAEDLVKPVVQRVHKILRPGGALLAFFHTKDAGPDSPYHRYHIASTDTLDMQRITTGNAAQLRLQRVFNNRHIENLFHDFASIKFFLGRDNIREVLVVR